MANAMGRWLFIASSLLLPSMLQAQPVLEEYVQEGLRNNIVLKEKKIGLDKSLVALKEARSLFLPSTQLEGNYTLAGGGRSIEIPIGDLLNPVYQTLNQLTGSEKFPAVKNSSEQFLPNNFYDLRLRTSMPLVNMDIRYNRIIRDEQVKLSRNEIDIYKRELVREIKVAYFTYLAAADAVSIYENALWVVQQNVKVNQSLLANGKGLPAYLSRSESELKKVETQLQTAKNEQENSRSYFNFLLNQPLTRPIVESSMENTDSLMRGINDKQQNITDREELKSLQIAGRIGENVLKMNESFHVPKLNAFLDLGSQGYQFKLNNQSLFYLGGLQLTVPIFQGNRNLYKIEQAKLDLQHIALQTSETAQQLELAASTSRNNVLSMHASLVAARKQLESARQYFKLIDRGYGEGVNSFIEYLDARNQLTSSQMQVNISKYKLAAAVADYERQVASYSIQ